MLTWTFVRHLFILLVFSSCTIVDACAQYRHKAEADIAAMTPAQRVDEYADEQAYHKYDLLDQQHENILRYILRDGLTVLPRIIEIMNAYDPTKASGTTDHKGERFDAMWMLLGAVDGRVARLRALPQGRQAMNALARAVDRMRAAGYGKKGQHEWE